MTAAVADLMLREPKVLPADASVADVRAQLDGDHVHMALLTRGTRLVGTVVRSDLPTGTDDGERALPFARLDGRTVTARAPAASVREHLLAHGGRRVAVVDADGVLLGLMCLKRRRHGFCSDLDVAARAAE